MPTKHFALIHRSQSRTKCWEPVGFLEVVFLEFPGSFAGGKMLSAESEDEPHSSPRKSMSPSLQATFGLTIDNLNPFFFFFHFFDQLEIDFFFISSLFSLE